MLPESRIEGARQVAERAQAAMILAAMPHPQSPVSAWVTLSMGVATIIPSLEADPGALVLAADQALYSAKDLGRDRIVMASQG